MSYQIGQKVWFINLCSAEPDEELPCGRKYFSDIVAMKMTGTGEITQTNQYCFTQGDGHAWKTTNQIDEVGIDVIEPVREEPGRDFKMANLIQYLESLLRIFFNPAVTELEKQNASEEYSEITFHLQKEYGLTIVRPHPTHVQILESESKPMNGSEQLS